MREIKTIDEFNEMIKETNCCFLFYTKWCPICKMLIIAIDEYEEEMTDVNFVKVCITDSIELSAYLKVNSAPTTLFYQNGKLIDKVHGMFDLDTIKEIFYH